MAETSETDIGSSELLQLTSDIVAAHVSNNSVPSSELSGLIEQVYRTLEQVGKGPEPEADKPIPAISVKKSK